jgi:predicted ribonuclease YlaK
MPFADHTGGIEGIKMLIEQERLEVIPLAFLRGRDIRNSIIYSMESENLTKEHIQLIMGRVGEGS